MALILHIETATAVCSVGLSDGASLVGLVETNEGLVHAERLAVFIKELLDQSRIQAVDLDGICISIGPGSYTGLRVGLSTAKGLAFGLDVPVIALSTMDLLAWAGRQRYSDVWILTAMDARRQEVYAALYDPQGQLVIPAMPLILDQTQAASWLPPQITSLQVVGDGSPKVEALWGSEGCKDTGIRCSAAHMPALGYQRWQAGQFDNLIRLEPFYLKPANVTLPKIRYTAG